MGDHVKRRRSDSIASGPESKRPNMNSDGHDQPPESDQPEPVSATDENHSPASPSAPPAQEAPVKSTYITIRALIVTQDASIIIGKGPSACSFDSLVQPGSAHSCVVRWRSHSRHQRKLWIKSIRQRSNTRLCRTRLVLLRASGCRRQGKEHNTILWCSWTL